MVNIQTNDSWEKYLEIFLKHTNQYAIQNDIEFIIVGSVCTALQGCNIIPNDLDVLATKQEYVHPLADLMQQYELDHSPTDKFNDDWLSSKEQRVISIVNEQGTDEWYFARWLIDAFKIEIASIEDEGAVERSRNLGNIWENGPDMYPYAKKIEYKGYKIKVIPLELQLSTCLFRNQQDRIDEIIRVFNEQGYDKELLIKGLTEDQYKKIKQRLE